MKSLRTIPLDYRILLFIILLILLLPLVMDDFLSSLAILILYWAFLGNAWNIMAGYAGQFSFGHAVFYGIGAYTSTVLLLNFALSPWIGMLIGAIIAGLFGLFMAYLLFRFGIKGHFFALGTFAIAEMVRLLATELKLINTSIGLTIPLIRSDSWLRMQFEIKSINYFYVIGLIFAIGMILTIAITRSKIGYYFQAIREDEDAAAAIGVDVLRYKMIAVGISGALTAMAGTFFTQYFFFVNPTLAFGVAISVQILLRPIVGGVGTIWGPLVGALLLTPLAEFTRAFVRNPPEFLNVIKGRAGVDVMLFGVILILVVLYMPGGIMDAGKKIWLQMRRST